MRRWMNARRPMLSSINLVLERNRLVMAANNVRVLSIQSHVVSGYVGNKSACFPLQVLGFEVDTINSVQFSNHTGYKSFKGQVLDNNQLGDLIDGLKDNSIDFYSHLLTGYIGSKSFLEKVKSVVEHLKTVNPNLIYVCDPVMGDHGKMYVPEDLLPVYRKHIVPLADIITPNQYEAELLSGRKIKNEGDAMEVMKWFHEQGAKTVVLSSTELGSENELLGLASSVINGTSTRLQIGIPRLPVNFTGTGDLFASLLLGWMHHTDSNLKKSVENTVDTMQTILRRTLDMARQEAGPNAPLTVRHLELKLVQSLDDIRNPVSKCQASVLEN
ncbi:pyridoxal kinase-like isoform X1 [Penaeus chinensis]|uniref:pyridoxal kinase-like isoform X1 n=2 Tax=Penaeus chinensis TaxID=139456 RepID=UPI001FB7433F|nr:pyridoxal kinase-like isoform X1 [Penaeus chinensis]